MRVWTGKCRMPIDACSEFRDNECPKFCYYNTIYAVFIANGSSEKDTNVPNMPPNKEKPNEQ